MRRSDLVDLDAKVRVVEHNGLVYHLHSPGWTDYGNIQSHLIAMSKKMDPNKGAVQENLADDSSELMVKCVMASLRFEDEPDTPPTRHEVERILMGTGMHGSPVAKAAMEMCGINADPEPSEAEEDNTETPFS